MFSFTQIQDGIYTWVNGETSFEAVWQFENGPIPDKPFFALRLLNFTQIGDAEFIEPESPINPGDYNIFRSVNFTLEVLGFGAGCMSSTLSLQSSLNVPTTHQTLKDQGVISWNNENAVLDISGIDNDQNEERSFWEVPLRTTGVVTDVPLGAIETVNIEGTLKNPGKNDIIRNINVDSTI